MRLACDTGGTFTDLIVEDDGKLTMFKAPTVPSDPAAGIIDALRVAAQASGEPLAAFLGRADAFIHGTTHAINAIITGNTARTALLTTAGHPDILLLREGGRAEPFNATVPFPEPYIPRALTREVHERIDARGAVRKPLDEPALRATLRELAQTGVEAIAVCLLWSILNPDHELRVGELIEEVLPGTPYTLSHQLNPAMREYRRASATAIDASLKPLMVHYLSGIERRLGESGFRGRTLVLTSQGGAMAAEALARAPIHAINSGPSMAPFAGRHYAATDGDWRDIIIADTGGTTYDVSLVRNGVVPRTRETWIGQPYRGHMTGFPSVDVKSVGAGGGSIAWMDAAGALHVGPQSAGANPGPACFGRGGHAPTVTDACVVLGYLDPDYFLGGAHKLDANAAARAIDDHVAQMLGCSVAEAAASIIALATENMVQAIVDITVNQGIDPANAVLIGGGGAAGLNSVFIARRLGCRTLIFPEVGAALSAAGALISDLTAEYRGIRFTATDAFDRAAVNALLDDLEAQCLTYARANGDPALGHAIEFVAEARYPSQAWEIEVPLGTRRFDDDDAVGAFEQAFHAAHQRLFAISDPGSVVEIVSWSATVRCRLRPGAIGRLTVPRRDRQAATRPAYFSDAGWVDARVLSIDEVGDTACAGPALIESPFTTVVVDPGATFHLTSTGNLIVEPLQGAPA